MFGLGAPELILIGLILVLLFGGKKIGEIGSGLGQGIRNFRKALKDDDSKQGGGESPQGPQKG